MQYIFLRASHFADATCVASGLFAEYSQKTCYGSEKGNTFYQSGRQDHVSTNLICGFRLTGDTFYSAFTDLTDTDTGTDCSKACSNSSSGICKRGSQQYE
jgi:hypothetical protein